jgi:hypothetical protein
VKRITPILLGLAGLAVALGLTMGAMAFAGGDVGDVVHPRLDDPGPSTAAAVASDEERSDPSSPAASNDGDGPTSGPVSDADDGSGGSGSSGSGGSDDAEDTDGAEGGDSEGSDDSGSDFESDEGSGDEGSDGDHSDDDD